MTVIHVCGKCQAQYFPKLPGVVVIQTAGDPPKPVRIWSADVLACPICGAELITNFGHEPTMESYEAGFEAVLEQIPQHRRRVVYSPMFLVSTYFHETKEVKNHAKTN